MKRLVLLLLVSCFCLGGAMAQKTRVKNLYDYDDQWIHFGFSLAVNQATFIVHNAKNIAQRDTLLQITPKPQLGFNLAIVSDLRLHKWLTLRCLPALSFQDRTLEYTLVITNPQGVKDTVTFKKNGESTYIEVPFDLKLRSSRLNNISCYILSGMKYGVDLASQKDVKNSTNPKDVIIKLKKHDWSYSAGFGIDYYFQYFKFSTEVKCSWGMRDLLIKENDSFSSSIDKLNSRVILFSMHFEG
jgi:hypothetical protein